MDGWGSREAEGGRGRRERLQREAGRREAGALHPPECKAREALHSKSAKNSSSVRGAQSCRYRLVTSSHAAAARFWSTSAASAAWSRQPLVMLRAPPSHPPWRRLLPLTAGWASHRRRGRSSSSQAKKQARRSAQFSSCASGWEQKGQGVKR